MQTSANKYIKKHKEQFNLEYIKGYFDSLEIKDDNEENQNN